QRARQRLEPVGRAERPGRGSGQLAGGQQQRVAIARALVNRPALVLGDEPTGAGDTETAGQLLVLMRALNREEGVTFVIVTNDLELAASMDRVIRLRDGRGIADERPGHAMLARSADGTRGV